MQDAVVEIKFSTFEERAENVKSWVHPLKRLSEIDRLRALFPDDDALLEKIPTIPTPSLSTGHSK